MVIKCLNSTKKFLIQHCRAIYICCLFEKWIIKEFWNLLVLISGRKKQNKTNKTCYVTLQSTNKHFLFLPPALEQTGALRFLKDLKRLMTVLRAAFVVPCFDIDLKSTVGSRREISSVSAYKQPSCTLPAEVYIKIPLIKRRRIIRESTGKAVTPFTQTSSESRVIRKGCPHGLCTRLRIKRSGFEPCCVLG